MKEIERCVFVREYSAIEGLQQAGSIRYSLAQAETGVCLLVQRLLPGGGPKPGGGAVCRLDGLTLQAAQRLLRYLYENGVEPADACAVASDCLGALAAPAGPSGG
ncbi:MAG TPA: hypothetical protein H9915_06825 [Candidatus Gemmiger faecigallinarum]|nr:hypothetical protein [Candidatus Gemmiger faecigallinarum]